jgi:hypothetical protein
VRDVNLEGANAKVACWAGWAEKGREEVGRDWDGKGGRRPGRIPCSGLESKQYKIFWIKIGLEIQYKDSGGRNMWRKIIPRKLHRIWECKNGDLSEFWSTRI